MMQRSLCTWLVTYVFTCWILIQEGQAKVVSKVRCSEDMMQVELVKTDDITAIYLENMKQYPDPVCHPVMKDNKAEFNISLLDVYQCGVTRIYNRITGHRTFYHRVVLESGYGATKQIVLVKCVIGASNHTRLHKRNVLPAGFQEPEDLQIRDSLTGIAPEPLLNVGVRQGANLVTGELNVNPGTPLQMEIYLDKSSAPVYGLLVSYMKVSDTRAQEETIIFNGCSVDPYLFENFNTVDGDFLTAKFRAFKFPESTYVQFKGTVNVCLDKCLGVDCSNGQKGYGRRKREVNSIPADSNKVFEVTMTTFIKVDYKDDKLLQKGKLGASVILPKQNETVVAEITSDGVNNNINQNLKLAATERVSEEIHYTVILHERNAATVNINTSLAISLVVFLLMGLALPH